MCLFTLFLKSEKRSGFVFANTCYQKDINLSEKNKTGKGNFTGSQDIHGLLDSVDCTVKINVSKQVLTYRIYHYRNVWKCMPREAKNKVQLTASARQQLWHTRNVTSAGRDGTRWPKSSREVKLPPALLRWHWLHTYTSHLFHEEVTQGVCWGLFYSC